MTAKENTMKTARTILAALCGGLLAFQTGAAFARSVKIVAVVNGDIISTEDIDNKAQIFTMTTRIPMNAQTRPMIMNRVLQSAIDEKIKLQDAEKNGINITDQDIDVSIANFEKQNNIPNGGLKKMFKQNGTSYETYRQQVKSELAWGRLVRRNSSSDLVITQKEIEKTLQEALNDLATPKYQVSEIFIRKKNAKNLNDLVSNLRNDPRFELYAAQFSESPSASSGGNLGWVNQGKLAEPLEKALSKMKPGDISDTIPIGEGFYVLKLQQTFDPSKDKPQQPTAADIKKFLENQKMEEYAKKHLQDIRQAAVIEVRN